MRSFLLYVVLISVRSRDLFRQKTVLAQSLLPDVNHLRLGFGELFQDVPEVVLGQYKQLAEAETTNVGHTTSARSSCAANVQQTQLQLINHVVNFTYNLHDFSNIHKIHNA